MMTCIRSSVTPLLGLLGVVGLLCTPAIALDPDLSPDSSRVFSAADKFLLDTLTLEAARTADSARNATVFEPPAQNAGDTGILDAAALAGTRAGRGSISGRVVSEARGNAVAGVRVIVTGQNLSAETDAEGNFGIPDVAPGAHALFLYHGSYDPLTVDGFEVVAGRDVSRRFSLPDKALRGDAVRITGTAGRAGEAGLLFARKNAPSVSDGISAQQISKTPDGDAAAALKRVTGISVGGDGMVYVRGLGERYVNMQLNGLNISSPNPEKRVIPLDMFPTRLLENLVVSKTFTADQPAEFAGGSLQLRTKDYPDRRLIEVSVGAGYDPGVTFGTYLTYKGGSLDWLGVDDGTRSLSSTVPKERFNDFLPTLGDTPEEIQVRQRQIIASLPNVWTPHGEVAPFNQSYGLSMGNKIPLSGERVFGWLIGSSYSRNWSIDEEFNGRIIVDNEGSASYRDQVIKESHTDNVKWGLLGTATLQDSYRHKLRLNFLVNHDWEDEVNRTEGVRDADSALIFELANAHQTLRNVQIEGEHQWGREGTMLHWTAALTGASRIEPDQRLSRYSRMTPDNPNYNPAFPWLVGATSGLQDRYWFELGETGWAAKFGVEHPVAWRIMREGSKTSAGVYMLGKDREYSVRRLSYHPGPDIFSAPERFGTYDDYFSLMNGALDSGFISNVNERQRDNYTVNDIQMAAYTQADVVLNDSWRAILGVRLARARVSGRAKSPQNELSSTEVALSDCVNQACEVPFGYDRVEVLPAAALVHALAEDQNLRASWTRTFSYPEYREMSPMLFISYQESMETVGNIGLKPTSIQNYDVRWEWFATASEMVALSGFYKHFTDPVEVSIEAMPSNNRATFTNAPSADLWGVEGELRVNLDRVHDVLKPFQATLNLTWIHSEVEGEKKRAMQGQSPYLINAILFYEPFPDKMMMSLLYNRYGRRISKIGVGVFPDVYEEARESLEFSWSQTLAGGVKAKFTARNLTSASQEERQGGLTVKRIENTPTYSLGVSYAF